MSHKLRQWASRARRLIGNVVYSSAFGTATMFALLAAWLIMAPIEKIKGAMRVRRRNRVIRTWKRLRTETDMPKRRP